MPDYAKIYATQAEQYENLVAREDYQGNLLRAIQHIVPLAGINVVEFGAGTGRLTCMLAPLVSSIQAFDSSAHMLAVARRKLSQSGLHNWQLGVADHRHIPAPDRMADLAISGWSICYTVVGNETTWQTELSSALAEMQRAVRSGGMLIIIETLGTGCETPQPPAELAAYYTYLETHAFQRIWVRTDYLFRDFQEADDLTRFFFGDEMPRKIVDHKQGALLHECTGIWWRKNR